MNIPKNLGITLLAIYLILTGLIGVVHISLGALSFVVPLIALLAGLCLFIGK